MYESKKHQPISRTHFYRRLFLHIVFATGLMLGSLILGMAGYAYFEGLDVYDSFLNASMLLGGMGPVNTPQTHGGKIFAGVYALYAGIVFLVATGFILAPIIHRLQHTFHWDERK